MIDVLRSRLVIGLVLMCLSVSAAACAVDTAEDEATTDRVADDQVEFLFVQSAVGASLADGVLRLHGVSPTTIYFSDRPERLTGHIDTEAFVDWWDDGEPSFAAEPPNATLSILSGTEPQEIVVVLMTPRLESGDLVYDVEVLEGNEVAEGDGSSLFIDTIGHPATPHSAAGHHRRVRRRHVRHAGPGG